MICLWEITLSGNTMSNNCFTREEEVVISLQAISLAALHCYAYKQDTFTLFLIDEPLKLHIVCKEDAAAGKCHHCTGA